WPRYRAPDRRQARRHDDLRVRPRPHRVRGEAAGMSRKEVIVCVDDEEGVLRVLRAQLGARFGHEAQVLTARSGDEAVALFDALSREVEPIALVIADQIMPGMKGVELLEIVDRRLPTTMKILLTGQAGLD